MNTITVYNRGKRNFNKIKNAQGKLVTLERDSFVEMEEVTGLRLIADYPRDLTSSQVAGPSSSDLKRKEQSLRDRSKALDEREAALKAREDALAEREIAHNAEAPRRGPGRPPKAQAEAE